jgi:hypothetical protein
LKEKEEKKDLQKVVSLSSLLFNKRDLPQRSARATLIELEVLYKKV